MSKFYCKYCGVAFASVFALTNARCLNNPNGKNLPHVVYEGGEKSKYTCKYCGISFEEFQLSYRSPSTTVAT